MGKLLVPLARTKNLIVEELGNEVVVYDLSNDKAHCLNHTSAAVWKHCDGKRTAAEIAGLLEREMNAPVDERLVLVALDQLGKHRLFDEPFKVPPAMWGTNRRQMMRRLGLAALVAVPVITSIVAPTAAHAQSACRTVQQSCNSITGPFCCQGLNCVGGFCSGQAP
jgi:hypothetical protein